MLVGKTPFKGHTEMQTFENIKTVNYAMPLKVQNPAKDLIEKLLILDPEERLGAKDITDLKNHEFFEGLDFDNLRKMEVPIF